MGGDEYVRKRLEPYECIILDDFFREILKEKIPFFLVDIQPEVADATTLQAVYNCVAVNERATARVDHHHPVGHLGDRLRVYDVVCLVRQGTVETDDVRFSVEFIQLDVADSGRCELLVGILIVGAHITAETLHDARKDPSYSAGPYDSNPLAVQVKTEQTIQTEVLLSHPVMGPVITPVQRHDQTRRVFGDRKRTVRRHPHDGHPEFLGLLEVYVVEPGAAQRYMLHTGFVEFVQNGFVRGVVHKDADRIVFRRKWRRMRAQRRLEKGELQLLRFRCAAKRLLDPPLGTEYCYSHNTKVHFAHCFVQSRPCMRCAGQSMIWVMGTPVSLGLVGIGRAGFGMHCNELESRADRFQIAAACDTDEARLEKMRERYPGIRTYTDLSALLSDDDIELVDIATPSTLHADQAIAALQAGKTVFLEKPIATSVADAQRMVHASQETGVPIFFRHNRRFESGFQHIQEIIASGVLGEVFEIRLHRHTYQRRNDWQTLKSTGGGQLNNWGPHIIDHSLRFLDGEVASIWSNLDLIAAVGDAEDHLKIVFTGKSGCIVDMEISGGVALAQPTFLVFGSRGSLSCDDREITMRYLDPEQQLSEIDADPESPPIDGAFGNREELRWVEQTVPVGPELDVSPASIWDYLHDTLRNGTPFPVTTEQAMQVMEVIDQVKQGTRFA